MSDLLQEVDDMMRRERMERLWKEHGNFIIGGVVTIILATAVFSGIKSWNAHVRQSQTESLITALEDKDFTTKAQELAGEYGPGLKAITLLNAAAKQIQDGKKDEALALLKAASEDSGAPDDLAGLAVITASRLAPADQQGDYADKLEAVAKNSASPWAYHAAIEVAVMKAAKGDYKAAREHLLTVLSLPEDKAMATPGLVERARALDSVYAAKQKQASEKQEG